MNPFSDLPEEILSLIQKHLLIGDALLLVVVDKFFHAYCKEANFTNHDGKLISLKTYLTHSPKSSGSGYSKWELEEKQNKAVAYDDVSFTLFSFSEPRLKSHHLWWDTERQIFCLGELALKYNAVRTLDFCIRHYPECGYTKNIVPDWVIKSPFMQNLDTYLRSPFDHALFFRRLRRTNQASKILEKIEYILDGPYEIPYQYISFFTDLIVQGNKTKLLEKIVKKYALSKRNVKALHALMNKYNRKEMSALLLSCY